jgi:hypothetical protein
MKKNKMEPRSLVGFFSLFLFFFFFFFGEELAVLLWKNRVGLTHFISHSEKDRFKTTCSNIKRIPMCLHIKRKVYNT